ncbi:hypothetical protein PSI23_20615 [Xenorhabdus sp. XENO-10]|uniref:Uncharacterized protein n=1 Tax=Xenorhabdus yunnanensis TaxID=3025878 RepID=A0ABT5LPE3_9GAMM|nr:hypothetical protein [Xenorhabdus yunnanensis]MDC9591615.1 hypothetical protein [Xenorhabdus yunnanensis]
MNRFARVLFSLVLVSLSFSGHSFQASDTAANTHQISLTKVGWLSWFGDSSDLKHFYKSIKDAPNYPKGFRAAQNGLTKHLIKNRELLPELRARAPGKWYKVYKNGYNASNQKVSIHYFEHQSGLAFNVKVYKKWSMKRGRT